MQQRARKLARAFVAITVLTYGLIVLGALVRAHGAGLACPDWPLCFGQAVPRFDLRVAFEWSHRVAAGAISLLFVGASVAALRNPAIRPAVRTWILISGTLLALQITLGALTVLHLLASWTVTSHLLAGNAFALGLAFTARALLRLASPPSTSSGSGYSGSGYSGSGCPGSDCPGGVSPGLRFAVSAAGVLLFAQMVLGGLVSSTYAGLACSEWPACRDGVFFPGFEGATATHLLHRLGAYGLALTLILCAWLGRNAQRLGGLLRVGAALVLVQVGVGVANVLLRLPVEVTGLHSALAAGLVLTTGLSLAEAWRRSEPAGP